MNTVRSGSNRGSSPRWPALVLALAVLPVALWVFYEAQRTLRADLAVARLRAPLEAWVSGASVPKAEDWQDALQALQQAAQITPDDPDVHQQMGDLHVVAGRRDWLNLAMRREHFRRAASSYQAALALRPGEPASWAMLALSQQVLGNATAARSAWAKAQALGPYEAHIQPILLQIVLAGWDGATPQMQAWAKKLFDEGDAATRASINNMAKPYGLLFSPDAASAP